MDYERKEILARQLASSLIQEAPDGEALIATVRHSLLCSRADAQEVIYEAAEQINALLFPPLTQLELVLTEGCNLGCAYCFEKDMLGYRRMPFDVAQRAVDMLFRYSRNEPELDIAHFGGEPTLSFKTIQDVTEYARNCSQATGKRVRFNMTTNGVLLDEEMAAYCSHWDIRVLLSIDGLELAHDRYRRDKRGLGTFTRVMQGMRTLKGFQPWIGIKMTIMPDNVQHLVDDVRALYDMGVNQFTIGHATGVDWSYDRMQAYAGAMGQLNRWYQSVKGDDLRIDELDGTDAKSAYFGCQAGRSSVSVSVDGLVSPCSKVLALNNKTLLSRLGDVWCGLIYVKNRTDLVGCAKLKAACEDRGIADHYQGGCFVSNYNENGDLFTPSAKEHQLSILQRSACSGCGAKG